MISSSNETILTLEDLKNLGIITYFNSINQEDFEKTVALFAVNGELLAPFEKPIVGRNAIASYLSSEARGMELLPQEGEIDLDDDGTQQINITGQVKTYLFSVNVGWYFTLNQSQLIQMVKIKLLASPQELLKLNKIKQ